MSVIEIAPHLSLDCLLLEGKEVLFWRLKDLVYSWCPKKEEAGYEDMAQGVVIFERWLLYKGGDRIPGCRSTESRSAQRNSWLQPGTVVSSFFPVDLLRSQKCLFEGISYFLKVLPLT